MSDFDPALADEVRRACAAEATCYLLGAAHDASLSRLHRTTRFTQKEVGWLHVLGALLQKLGFRSWLYREGRERSVWALETSWRPPALILSTHLEKAAYARGYFDAEGGVPRSPASRFYVQFVQKDLNDLSHVRDVLLELGLSCGRLHNPSARVAPEYWRFYLARASHELFMAVVSSWHPHKRIRLETELARLGGCRLDRGISVVR